MNIICDAAMIINSNAVTTSLAGDSIIMTTCSGASTRPMLNKIGVNALAIVEAVVEGMLAIFVLRFAVAYECWHMLLLGASPVRAEHCHARKRGFKVTLAKGVAITCAAMDLI